MEDVVMRAAQIDSLRIRRPRENRLDDDGVEPGFAEALLPCNDRLQRTRAGTWVPALEANCEVRLG